MLARHQDLHRFVRELLTFRRAHPCLRRTTFFCGGKDGQQQKDISWFGPDGGGIDWAQGRTLACLIRGDRSFTGAETEDDHLVLLFNAEDHGLRYVLPVAPGGPWQAALTTAEHVPEIDGLTVRVEPRSVLVFVSRRQVSASATPG